MRKMTLAYGVLGSCVLTLVVLAAEAMATTCTTSCTNSNQCFGNNQTCGPCGDGSAGGCGVFYNWGNANVLVVQNVGSSQTSTSKANCYMFANCITGKLSSQYKCIATGCSFALGYSCGACTTGTITVNKVDQCSDNGCNES